MDLDTSGDYWISFYIIPLLQKILVKGVPYGFVVVIPRLGHV